MRFSAAVLALAMSTGPQISIFDSKTQPGKSWILVDDCAVEVKTTDIKDNPEKILKQVNDFCDLKLDNVSEKK